MRGEEREGEDRSGREGRGGERRKGEERDNRSSGRGQWEVGAGMHGAWLDADHQFMVLSVLGTGYVVRT